MDFPVLKLTPGGPTAVESALQISNQGSGYIAYSAVIDESWDNTFQLVNGAKGAVFKNETANVQLRCAPKAAGLYFGTLLVKTNLPDAKELLFKLKCGAYGANTPAADPSQSPGKITKKGGVNEDTLVNFKVNNPGDKPLNATPTWQEPQPGVFTFSAKGGAAVAVASAEQPSATTYEIAPGGTLEIEVQCKPPGPGVFVANLSIATNDPYNPTLEYDISCEGAFPPLPEPIVGGAFYPHNAVVKGFDGLAMHPAGTELIAGTANENDLFIYGRNLTSGALTPIVKIGLGSMSNIRHIAYSPDGNSVYAASRDGNGIVNLQRNQNGGLTISQVLTRTTVYLCGNIKFCVINSMVGASALAVSPDGNQVYVAGQFDDTLTTFTRNPADGKLFHRGHFTRTIGGVNAIGSPMDIAISPDGRHLYLLAADEEAIAIFERQADGALVYLNSLRNGQMGLTNFTMPTHLALSADGKQLFVTSRLNNMVYFFRRSLADGGLKLIQSLPGITGAAGIAVSDGPEARRVFVAAQDGDGILNLAYDPVVNKLILVNAVSHAQSPNLNEPQQLVVSPNGRQVYASLWDGGGLRQLNTFQHKPGLGPISPASAVAGSKDFVITLNGARFYPGAQAIWNGKALETTLINDQQVQATVKAVDVFTAGPVDLLVRNLEPGGGDSNVVPFVVTAPADPPVPSIESLNPPAAEWGSADTTVTVKGQNFTAQTQALLNGKPVQTFFVNETTLVIFILAADLQEPGALGLTVVNNSGVNAASSQAPTSSPVFAFTTAAPGAAATPAITRLEPAALPADSAETWLTVIGANFSQGHFVDGVYHSSVARWDGKERPTLVTNGNQLALALSATDLATPGQHTITIFTPGVGESNPVIFTVLAPGENPAPQIASHFIESVNGQSMSLK